MQELKKYSEAVARRKPYNHLRTINWAILPVLVEEDIPLLLEIIDTQNKALQQIMAIGDEWDSESEAAPEDAAEMNLIAVRTLIRVEELSAHGSKSKFGEAPNGNGHNL